MSLAKVGREHGIRAVAMRPKLQVRPEIGFGHLGQQLSCSDHFDVSTHGESFIDYIGGFPAMRRAGHVPHDAAEIGAVDS